MVTIEDKDLEATSLGEETRIDDNPEESSELITKGRQDPGRGKNASGKSQGVSKGWKIAAPILAVVGLGAILSGGHFGTVAKLNADKNDELTNINTGLNKDKDDLNNQLDKVKDELDNAKKPTTVVFDESQISQVSIALVENKGIPGGLTGLKAQHFDVDNNILTLYFDGIEGGKEVVFSAAVKVKDSKFTSEDAKLALETQKPMCQIFRSIDEFKLNAGVYEAAQKTNFNIISSTLGNTSTQTVTINDIKMEINISRNSAKGTAKVTYKALLIDGEKMSIVAEGSMVGLDYDITSKEANSQVIENFIRTYGSQASAQIIEEDEM